MEWDEVLDSAQTLYTKNLQKELRSVSRSGLSGDWLIWQKETIPESVADKIVNSVRNATFETDAFNKPGIWHFQEELPKSLAKEVPKLRSYDQLQKIVNKATKSGMSGADIYNMPESYILRNRRNRRGN